MAVVIEMPKLGVTMEEGRIVSWKKEISQNVNQGEVLLEVETEKVTLEYECAFSGVLAKILAAPGDIVKVGEPICILAEEGEDISNLRADGLSSNDQEEKFDEVTMTEIGIESDQGSQQEGSRAKASPVVKKLARQHGVDLNQVSGSGPGGRVQKSDFLAYLEGQSQKNQEIQLPEPRKEANVGGGVKEIIPLTSIRGVIGRRMQQSILQAPQGTQFIDVDMTETLKLRDVLKNGFQDAGVKLTITSFLIKTVARALSDHPMLNSVIQDEKILVMEDINIGIATDIDSGLVVPVIKRVQDQSLLAVSKNLQQMVDKAREKKLTAEDMSGGTFTISNLGAFGIGYFTPLINLPESAILGVGSIEKKVVVVDEEMVIRPIMCLSLTLDHRSLDGAPAARFFQGLKRLLETPWQNRISDVNF